MDYKQMLKRAREILPEKTGKEERFEAPRVMGHIQGNRTVISNFHQIASKLRRPPEHLQKYLLKELATPGEITSTALIIGTKVSASRVNAKVLQYLKDFIYCPECRKPDTKLQKEDKITFLKCQACGARHAVKVKI